MMHGSGKRARGRRHRPYTAERWAAALPEENDRHALPLPLARFPTLRNCLGTCSGGHIRPRGAGQAAQHDPAHRRIDHFLSDRRQSFVVPGRAPRLPIRPMNDLDSPATLPIHLLTERSRVPRVGPDERQAGQRLAHPGTQQTPPAIPIMRVCAVDFGGEQQASRVDEDPPKWGIL